MSDKLRSTGLACPLRGWMFALPNDNNPSGEKYSTSRYAIGTAIEGKFRVLLRLAPGTPDPQAVGVFAKINGEEIRLGYIPASTRTEWAEKTGAIRADIRDFKHLYGHLEYFQNHPVHNDFCLVVVDGVANCAELPDEDNIVVNAISRQFRNAPVSLDNPGRIPDNVGVHADTFRQALKEMKS